MVGKEVQEALTKPPYNFIPINKDVVLPADLPMKSLDEMTKYVEHDWARSIRCAPPGSRSSTRKWQNDRWRLDQPTLAG